MPHTFDYFTDSTFDFYRPNIVFFILIDMISIRRPLFFSEIGEKENQEEAIYPIDADRCTRTFILCDSMGSHQKGEMASRTVALTLGDTLSSETSVDIPAFNSALSKAYKALDQVACRHVATSMACLCLNDDNYLVSHSGHTRIYHFRPSLFDPDTRSGGLIYQSPDHSPESDFQRPAETLLLDDIREGDYFFICSDGVMESLYADTLCEILANPTLSDEDKLQAIHIICSSDTKNNYSCWLIPVDKVEIKGQAAAPDILPSHSIAAPRQNVISRIFNPKVRKVLSWCGYFILLCALVFLIYEIWTLLFSYEVSFPHK